MKCLLASDDLMFGTQATHVARSAGYEVIAVADAVSLLTEDVDEIDLLLVDLNLPGFDAQATVDHIRTVRLEGTAPGLNCGGTSRPSSTVGRGTAGGLAGLYARSIPCLGAANHCSLA